MLTFNDILIKYIKFNKHNKYKNNFDFRRHGKEKISLKEIIKRIIIKLGFYKFILRKQIWKQNDKFSWLYYKLEKRSRDILIKIMAFRIMGYKYVKLPLNSFEYWSTLERLEYLFKETKKVITNFRGWSFGIVNLESEGYPIKLYSNPLNVYNQIILEQYRYKLTDYSIGVEVGDVVIDAGACYGATAINFAFKTGVEGRVYSFEFIKDNIAIFKKNLELNKEYANRIELLEYPLWSSSDKKLYVYGEGPGSRVSSKPPKWRKAETTICTYTIDDLYRDRNLSSIDFIKMDIEGAELEALKGAIISIRKFKPKLAISVYHRINDFWEIPKWIDSLELGYKFHLGHFTIHKEETVLFAIV